MEKKNPSQHIKTKTTENKTAALRATDTHKVNTQKRSSQPVKDKVPVVKDIDEGSADRR